MEAAQIAMKQTAVMFLYMLAGYCLFRTKKLTEKGSREIASLLVCLVIPVVIINSFCVEFSAQQLAKLGISTLLGAVALAIAMGISHLVFRKNPIEDFGTAFSNAGFMGIPLVKAALGTEAVFYLVGIIAILNILQATYGVSVLTGGKRKTGLRAVLMNPILIGTVIGLVLFLTGLGTKLPGVVTTTIGGIASLNSPLAMLVLGAYLAQGSFKKLITSLSGYYVSLWRLVLIPVVTLGAFLLLPGDGNMKLAVLLAAAAPVGANVAVYSQLNDLDYSYACQIVALSTVLSVVTLPLNSLLGAMLF